VRRVFAGFHLPLPTLLQYHVLGLCGAAFRMRYCLFQVQAGRRRVGEGDGHFAARTFAARRIGFPCVDQVHLLKAGLRVQASAFQFEFQELINRRLRRGFRGVRGEGGAQRGQSN